MLRKRLFAATGVVAALMAALLLAACGGSSNTGTGNCPAGTMKMSNGQVMCKSAMGGNSKSSDNSVGKTVHPQVSLKVPEVNGQKPVAVQTLASTDWQGMTIEAQTTTPVAFSVFNGTTQRKMYPSKDASFHLMIMLNDRSTQAPIPYSSVWATITNSKGQTVFHNLQWPMLSAFMGPHYGNTVNLPGSGRYKLSLLVSPPEAGRGTEYKSVWLHPHTVTMNFKWDAKTRKATVIDGGGSSAMQATSGSGSGGSSMSGMSATGGMSMDTSVHNVNGITEAATHTVANATWQGMRIETLTAKPASYYIYNGTNETRVKPSSGASVDLMVELKDTVTGVLIPYSTVHATIKDSTGKVVYTGALTPTISAFQGIYYGNDVKLPTPGPYTVTLTIGAPRSARHKEYWHVWLRSHRVVEHITWDGQQ
jgi:uncharacterized protein involved in high-affinity Fe2+ transport